MAYAAKPLPVGTRIGRLEVIAKEVSGARRRTIMVRCDCGTEKMMLKTNLTGKRPAMSCGHCDNGIRARATPEALAARAAGKLRKRGRLAFYRDPFLHD